MGKSHFGKNREINSLLVTILNQLFPITPNLVSYKSPLDFIPNFGDSFGEGIDIEDVFNGKDWMSLVARTFYFRCLVTTIPRLVATTPSRVAGSGTGVEVILETSIPPLGPLPTPKTASATPVPIPLNGLGKTSWN